MARKSFGERSPHRRSLARRDDADGGTPSRSENTTEFGQTPGGIREEHQAKLADHGVEDAFGERQGDTIHLYRSEPRITEPRICGPEHLRRDIRAEQDPGRSKLGQRDQRGLTRASRDVENSM